MTDTIRATEYTIEQFIDDVKAVIDRKGVTDAGLSEIADKMQALSRQDDLFDQGQWREPTPGGNTIGSYRLHSEPDDTLILSISKFSHEHPTPVHTHNTWGVICGYRGRDRYEGFERVDDGSVADHAELKVVVDKVLEHGDAVYWLEYPRDIHRQQAFDEPSWELLLMGRSTRGIGRLHFEPEQNKVWDIPPATPAS
jgi:predicted metal-dependent enzyme (double-stranded beta helix superfamily)